VSSPVGNIGLGVKPFQDAVHHAFAAMYGSEDKLQAVGEEALEEMKVKEYMDETKVWIYSLCMLLPNVIRP